MNKTKHVKIAVIGKEKRSGHLSIIVERQFQSVIENSQNMDIQKFLVNGTGIQSYFKSYANLKKKLQYFDIVHAHYSFSGVLAVLSSNRSNVVVSFMGDDVYSNSIIHRIARFIVLRKAHQIIVKSKRMKSFLPERKNIQIIPNGVDLESFKPLNTIESKLKLGWNLDRLHILFPSSISRTEKKFDLAKKVCNKLNERYNLQLHTLENIKPSEVVTYLNACDIVLLTSKWEGSSNVTKEAMACNTVVVSTDVGDTSELFSNTQGYFISEHSYLDAVHQLEKAISFLNNGNSANGRTKIKQMKLDAESVAVKILNVYKRISN